MEKSHEAIVIWFLWLTKVVEGRGAESDPGLGSAARAVVIVRLPSEPLYLYLYLCHWMGPFCVSR